jgi:Reverse transcriptase (RNA-dependent DNA polymerase)/RNase H-like domain found in reverse transcriptase
VKIADESSENILGIDFLQKFRLHLDPKMKEITFQSAPSRALFATKNFTIPPFATTLVQARTFQNIDSQLNYIADIGVPKQPLISGLSTLVSFDHRNQCTMPIQNCAPHEVNISTGDILGILSTEKEEPIPFNDDSLATICEQIHQRLPKVKKRAWTREEIEERCHLGAPEPYRSQYIYILVKHQAAISLDKYDLGLAKNFTHRIHLKDNQPIFRKQFHLPEAHTQFIEQSLDEWLKLGVVRQSSSDYNSPIFCVPKKQGQGLRIVQDFRLLNQHSHIDKYSMKEISECIGDIGRANSSIFTTLDLTSGFWQMKLDPESQPLTAFTIPNRGQFHCITSPMGLLGCPASFQRLMEQVLRGLSHILIYIDHVLIHTDTHEKHLEALEQVLMRLQQHHLKINLDKCLFGDQQVSYLGFTLTPEGIKPGEAKLKTIRQATPPDDVKGIRSFMGLCNFFRHHIQDFAIIAAPLFKLTRQDSDYQSGPLTEAALTAFQTLQDKLSKQPALAFPRHDWNYLLITNAYLQNKDSPGGLCANLAQWSDQGKIQIISHASRQLKENEKNYTRFLLETAAAAWGMDNFNKYLKGSKFTLYRDLSTETTLGTTQLKTLNRLKNTMIDHNFEVQDRQKSDLPGFLKTRQTWRGQEDYEQDQAFNKIIHVDLINADTNSEEASGKTILSITDESRTFTQVAVIANAGIDSTVSGIWHYWCQPYGPPETILLNQGKVQTSKLESRINELTSLGQMIRCRSSKDTFNQEIQHQWQQNQNEILTEEFARDLNLLCNLQNPTQTRTRYTNQEHADDIYQDLTD